jgi:transcriptional regulator with XRE-family HTH domain
MSASPQKDAQKDAPSDIHPLDLHVGNRLRLRRLCMNLTQEKLANLVGLTFQQVQKYEHGSNRISASRLYEIATALKVPVSYFYEEIPGELPSFEGMAESGQDSVDADNELDPIDMSSRETFDLLRAYYRITDQKKRKKILDLIRVMTTEA